MLRSKFLAVIHGKVGMKKSVGYTLPVALFVGLTLSSSHTAFANVDATLLAQESSVTGTQNVYVTAKALRIDNQKTGTTIVCKAPKWDVDIYNKRNRSLWHCPADQFKASFFQAWTKVYRENVANLKWKKSSVEMRNGIEVSKLSAQFDRKRARFDFMDVDVRSAEYDVGSGFRLPEKACNVLATFYSMPLVGEIPLQCIFYGVHAETLTLLKTKEVKKISVLDPFFEVPKFSQAQSERDVFIDQAARDAIEDMVGGDPISGK